MVQIYADYPSYSRNQCSTVMKFIGARVLDRLDYAVPTVILSPTGMLVGPCIKHYLKLYPNPENAIVLVGYQAAGTPGRQLLNGGPVQVMHNNEKILTIPAAKIHHLSGFSAHADNEKIVKFLKSLKSKRYMLIHGDNKRLLKFRNKYRAFNRGRITVPRNGERYRLDLEIL